MTIIIIVVESAQNCILIFQAQKYIIKSLFIESHFYNEIQWLTVSAHIGYSGMVVEPGLG